MATLDAGPKSDLAIQVLETSLRNEKYTRDKLEKLVDAQQLQVEEHRSLRLKLEALLRIERERVGQLERQVWELQAQLVPKDSEEMPQDPVRLQILLRNRDKQLDDLSHRFQDLQKETDTAHFQVALTRQEVATLRAEAVQRGDELQRSMQCEAQLRAQIFQLRDELERLQAALVEEQVRSSKVVQATAALQAEQERFAAMETKMVEEKEQAKQEFECLAAQSEESNQTKDQTIRHQTSAMEALNHELKEKQVEIDKLTAVLSAGEEGAKGVQRIFLPPLGPKPMEDVEVKRSIDNLRKQLKAKESKLSKQTERLQGLGELLEERDVQLQELTSARRDREKLRLKLADLEDAVKTQKKVLSRADAERRLISQEARLKESERRMKELADNLHREREERQTVTTELRTLEQRLVGSAVSAGAMDDANEAMAKELAEHRVKLDMKCEEVGKLEEMLAASQAEVKKLSERVRPEVDDVASLPQVQRKLRKLEELDEQLARDVIVHLQDREKKIDTLSSTVALLRQTVDDMQPKEQRLEPGANPELF
ncbi:Hypothetical protein SCF082_LOCUS10804 [Durusdinium trenchii]|uniref:Uncharacterized protein n=1 Tax=Durusdinium trenchii TaxID=1381693 RepID=A0ABP0J972_9DINO